MPPVESFERLADTFAALDTPTERKRMLVIVNPYATTVSDRLKNLVVYALQGRYEVDAIDTQARGHATELCREAAEEGYDIVVAFGGDGTINEVANGLCGSDTALGILPGGATNVLCRMLGLPTDIVDATEHLLRLADDWRPRRLDLARVNGRHYTFSAGMGLDAEVVRQVDAHPRLKARLGPWYFSYAALGTVFRNYLVDPPQLDVELPGAAPVRGVTALVQNGDPFTYFRARPVSVASAGDLADGTLSGVVLQRSAATVMPTLVWRLLSRRVRVADHRAVAPFEHVTDVTVRSVDERPVALQVDGDYIGDVTEAVFGITPGGILVVA
jgi:diacylglycerol kinase family enzyme